MDALYAGNYLEAGIQFATCAAEVFTFGYASEINLGVKSARVAAESSTEALVTLGRGSTGRTVANNLAEQMAMENITANPTLGKVVMEGMKDSRWLGWSKMQYTVTSENGVKAVVHYVSKFENGVLKYVDDFKFK